MPNKYEDFSDSEVADKAESIFLTDLDGTEILSLYCRGFLSAEDLLSRLEDLRASAIQSAPEYLAREVEESRRENIGELYAEAEGA